MSEMFTATEYAVLAHLKCEGQGTIPDIAADLLMPLGETEKTLYGLIAKGLLEQKANMYCPTPLAMDIPLMPTLKAKKSPTGLVGRGFPAAAALPMPMPMPPAPAHAPALDVSSVFRQARERAGMEQRQKKAGGAF